MSDELIPAKRMIFPFFNGAKVINGDPLVIDDAFRKALAGEDIIGLYRSASINPETLIETIPGFRQAIIDDEIDPANAKLLKATRAAFRLSPPDEDGSVTSLTEDETMDLLDRFNLWITDQKKEPEPSLSSSEPTPESPSPSTD